MKKISIVLAAMLLLTPALGRQNYCTVNQAIQSLKNSGFTDKTIKANRLEADTSIVYLTSTYDNPAFADQLIDHRKTLKKLSDENVFSVINAHLFQTLDEKHKQHFASKNEYELLFVAKGHLFQKNSMDGAFVVYDKINQRVSIVVFSEKTAEYSELYRDLKIENGLKDANCNYSAVGTLDFQLANEMVYKAENWLENPISYLESVPCKIADITKDNNFELESGCFSKKTLKNTSSNSLCIATSAVYNNWECLKYDETTNTFLIFYGQAFAD